MLMATAVKADAKEAAGCAEAERVARREAKESAAQGAAEAEVKKGCGLFGRRR